MNDSIPNAVLTLLAPTAVGKTDLMIRWAEKYPIEIVSVDSAMVYKELSIGANKPSQHELSVCPHHVINVTTIEQGYSVGLFYEDSSRAIADILQRDKIPVLVGGTMMYIYQINQGLASLPQIDREQRSRFIQDFEKISLSQHYSNLQRVDPVFAAKVSEHDKQRISRGLEVFYLTGQRLSDYWSQSPQRYPYDLNIHGLNLDNRQLHQQRIKQRLIKMLAEGFIDEVALLKHDYTSKEYDFWSFVGYRQIRAFLDQELSQEELDEALYRSTWHLVKRQKTWLKKMSIPVWDVTLNNDYLNNDFSKIFEKYCLSVLKKQILRP